MVTYDLDGTPGNKGHVFGVDPKGKLRVKFWFHGDGKILWRFFDQEGKTIDSGNMKVPRLATKEASQ